MRGSLPQVRLPDGFSFGSNRLHIPAIFGAKPTCEDEAASTRRARPPLRNAESFYSVGSQHWRCFALYDTARICQCNISRQQLPDLDVNGTRNYTRRVAGTAIKSHWPEKL
jgi:hypothetical protein|eukprot:3616776-Prymnesium_polylepis.1